MKMNFPFKVSTICQVQKQRRDMSLSGFSMRFFPTHDIQTKRHHHVNKELVILETWVWLDLISDAFLLVFRFDTMMGEYENSISQRKSDKL